MKTLARITVLSAAIALLSASASGAGDKDAPPLPDAQKLFSWTSDEMVVGFSHSAELYGTEPFKRGSTVFALPAASSALQARGQGITYQYGSKSDGSPITTNTVDDYMAHNKVTGLLVLKNGAVVLEKYAKGIDSRTLWDSKSVGKSVASTLMGVALKDGAIKSLDDTVETYIPELKGSAYEGVPLRDMLRMASGVAWNEDYLDKTSDIVSFLDCTSNGTDSPGCILNHMKTLKRQANAAPGAVFNYSTGEAYLSALVVQRATGLSLAKYLEKKIWQPMGMEADGNWWTFKGVSFGGAGFNATLRDYGRIGLFVMNNGVLANGTAVLPDHWVRDAATWTAASAMPDYADNGQYGYMWWFSPAYDDGVHQPGPTFVDVSAPLQNTTKPAGAVRVQGRPASASDWTFAALGIFGQMIAINQKEGLVIVQWATWDKPEPICCDKPNDPSYMASNPYLEESTFVNAVLKALH